LEWVAPVPNTGINGYKIETESPIEGGWNTLVANTTTTILYYNHTGLDTSVIFHNYRVYALTSDGSSAVSNTYANTVHSLPESVDDLSISQVTEHTLLLTWTEPDNLGISHLIGYAINYTTPYGDPLTIITSNTENNSTSNLIGDLVFNTPYSFGISAVTIHGQNTTFGNIANATTLPDLSITNFTVGNFDVNATNTDTISPISFERIPGSSLTPPSSSSTFLNVTYPNNYDLSCNFDYRFGMTNQTYSNLDSIAVTIDDDLSSFNFTGLENEVVYVTCWDTLTGTSADYILTQSSFPILQQIQDFKSGDYGTVGLIGTLDLITMFVIIISMIGFNKFNEAVGAIFNFFIIGSFAYFGIIEIPTAFLGALATVLMLIIAATRKK